MCCPSMLRLVRYMLLASLLLSRSCVHGVGDDTLASAPEGQWFDAASHADEIHEFVAAWSGRQCVQLPKFCCFDVGCRYSG